jgi:hypothetical protein
MPASLSFSTMILHCLRQFALRRSVALLVFGLTGSLPADPILWQSSQVGTWQSSGGYSIVFTNLPDGRFLLGQQGKVSVQNTFGVGATTLISANGRTFDPSFIAVRSATSALLGAGGSFGAISGLHPFNPGSPITGVAAALATPVQNYTGAYWKSPTSALEGWLVAGANGPSGPYAGHNVIFVPISGATSRVVTEELCTYGAGIAVDAGGNLYTALYEIDDGTPLADETDKVLRFSAAQVGAAITNPVPAPLPKSAGAFLHKFDSASSIAVDGLGRVWSAGFKVEYVQVYDPFTGGVRSLVPDHAPLTGAGQRGYQVSAFNRNGADYVGFLAYDLYGTTGTPVIIGTAPALSVTVPNTLASWRAFRFGEANLTPANEATLWGDHADPDHDGLTNLAEYAFNTPPLAPNAAPSTGSRSGGLATLSFPRNPLNTDLSYIVEASGTLAANSWTAIAASSAGGSTTITSAPDGASSIHETAEGAMVRVTVTDQASAAGAPRRFLRLRLSSP